MTPEFDFQQNFYNQNYQLSSVGDFGFPDLKIVDYQTNVENKKILSVGGGNGADLWFLAGANEVCLVDGSEVAVAQSRVHGVQAVVGDAGAKLDYPDGYFDTVVLKDILEHIYNPMDLLSEAKRVLKTNGYIIISLPNHFYLPFRLRILLGGNLVWKSLLHNHKKDFEEWDYMHIRFFTWKGVKTMLKLAGLNIEKGYWDFGTLAHYSDPLMYEYAFKINHKNIQTKNQRLMYRVLLPAYKVFNVMFPRGLRSRIVSCAPGMLCAGFYLRVSKK